MQRRENNGTQPARLITMKEAVKRTGLGRSTIYAMLKRQEFPRPVRIGRLTRIGFVEAEVETWIAEQVQASRSDDATAPAAPLR